MDRVADGGNKMLMVFFFVNKVARVVHTTPIRSYLFASYTHFRSNDVNMFDVNMPLMLTAC